MPGNLALQIRHGLLAGLLAFTSPALAAGDEWFARPWQTDDGLLDSDVRALTQTPDGYVWVATETGLSRFDGVRFQTVWPSTTTAQPENNVDRLLVDSRGRFWMAMHRGNIVSVERDGTREYSEKEGLPKTNPTAVVEDQDGAIWIAFNNGIATRINHDETTNFNIAGDLPPNSNYCRLTRDDTGRIWIAKDKYIGIFNDGKFLPRATLERRVTRITIASGGGIWIFAGAELLRCREDGSLEKRAELPEGAGPTAVMEDRMGVLWIGTAAHGLYRYDGTELVSIQTSQRNISCLMEDREGNLWVGTNGGGLIRLRRRTVQVLSTASGAPFESLRSVCRDARGKLWAVTWNREMWRQDAAGWTRVNVTTNSQSGGNFSCVAADPAGPVWIGSHSIGLYRLQNGTFTHWTTQEGLINNQIQSLLVSSNGDLWLTTDSPSGSGLQRLRGDKWRTFALPAAPGILRTLAQDKFGNVWIGSADGRLLRVKGDDLSDETLRTRLPPVSIRCLAATEDGSLWIGYAGFGLGRLKAGKFSSITTAQGLSDDYISQIIDDQRGWFWFGGNRGIFKVREQELNDAAGGKSARVRSIVYERGEGVPGLQAAYETTPAGLRDSDGCLWLASRAGLVAIHAERIRDNPEPPPVRLDEVTANGRPIALYNSLAALQPPLEGVADLRNQDRRLTVPARHGKLEFDYAALSFTAPENVQFKYRLDNVDEDWVEAGTQRSISYPQLAAGDYQFHVIACNNSGVWNNVGATLNVTVLPFFWQRWWFRAAVLAGFTLSLIAVVRYVWVRRLQRQLRLMEQQAAVERERMRIARDIHDDLGDRLTTVAVLSGLVLRNRDTQPQGNGQHEHLERISATARQATDALDEIVWAINPRNDVLPNLINYIGQFAVEFLRTASVRCRLDLPDHPPDQPVPAEVRHNLFLVVKEALNNVVRHSGATEVHLGIIAGEKSANVVIEDNGRGFAGKTANDGGDGLRNMRQRMAEIGGEFKIESRPGEGTRITLEFPWRRGE